MAACRHLGLMLGAVFLALLVLPRAGWASCGDYLHHAARLSPEVRHNSGDENALPKPAPCRGPHCSARTPAPAIPAAPKFTPAGPRHQVYWLVQMPVHEVVARWKLDQPSDLESLLTAGRLFRPPRAA